MSVVRGLWMRRAHALRAVLVVALLVSPVSAQSVECAPADAACWREYARDLKDHRDFLAVTLALTRARLLEANARLAALLKEHAPPACPPGVECRADGPLHMPETAPEPGP